MNKTFNINLGGYPFSIDEDAYNFVQKYLDKIREHFSNSEGCDEILYDIEVRMAELFQEHLKGRKIVTMKEVDEIVMIMGKPEDFGAEPMDDSFEYQTQPNPKTKTDGKKYSEAASTRRLYRDPDDKKVGGVCSGIAAYFGIEDPLWVRLGFAFSIMFLGIPVFLYILLWGLIPEAKTSSDKLAMRGEPATIKNIANMIETELYDLEKRINEWGSDINDEYGSKNTDRKKKDDSQYMKNRLMAKNILVNGINLFGTLIRNIFDIITTVAKPLMKVLTILLFTIVLLSWIATFFGLNYASPAIQIMGHQNPFYTYSGIAGVMLFLGIPMIGLLLLILRLAWKYRIHTYSRAGLWALWIGSIFLISNSGVAMIKEYRALYNSTNVTHHNIADDVIVISANSDEKKKVGIHLGNFVLNPAENSYKFFDSSIEIQKSPDNLVHILKHLKSRGFDEKNAENNALAVSNSYNLQGNKINFDPAIHLSANTKFRRQDIDYTVQIPAGKKVIIQDDAKYIIRTNNIIKQEQLYTEGVTEWTISENGSNSLQYEEIIHHEKNFDVKPFKKLMIDQINADIVKGSDYSFKILGPKELIEKVKLKQIGELMMIDYEYSHRSSDQDLSSLEIKITVPNSLELIQVNYVGEVHISGFDQFVNVVANSDFDSKVVIEGNIDNVNANISGNQTITLLGTGNILNVKGNDGTIDGYKFIAKTVNIDGILDERSAFHVTEVLNLSRNSDRYNIVGNPKIKNVKQEI